MLKSNKIYQGDCQMVMRDIDSDSVDCIVTDPPYGLSFMSKDWDKAVPSIEIWQECLRVLKLGAFAFVMCIPRQDCLARMICRLEDAGFNVAFSSIYWTYAVGFPKAASLSKQADKRAGVPSLAKAFNTAGRGERKDLQNSKQALKYRADYGYEHELKTDQAKALEGGYSGMQLKPAVEIVIVAMKPIEEKTYLDQAMANMHGLTWLDDCRIPLYKNEQKQSAASSIGFTNHNTYQKGTGREYTNKGRFPANVLCEDDVLDDGIERKSGAGNKASIRNIKSSDIFKIKRAYSASTVGGDTGSFSRYFSLDAWFAERIKQLPKEAQKTFPFMIIPKASKSEKNRGLEDMPLKEKTIQGTAAFGNHNPICETCGGSKYKGTGGRSKECNCDIPVWKVPKNENVFNNHPTTKPLKLMSWLITLASREGDTVLDPFCGSGTTAIAAKMLGRQYIGIEREEEYCEIARKRISAIPQRLDSY